MKTINFSFPSLVPLRCDTSSNHRDWVIGIQNREASPITVYHHTVETPRLEGNCGVAVLIDGRKVKLIFSLPERLEFYMADVLKWFL